MYIDIERLKTDAAYWDVCGAPKDATHFSPEKDGFEPCWIKFDGKWLAKRARSKLGGWRNDDPDDNPARYIPRPAKPAAPEWDGEGLPPEGVRVEVSYTPDDERWWPAGQVIAYHRDWVVFEREGKNRPLIRPYDCVRFRPTRTPEQRQRDELIKIIKEADEMAYSFRPDDLADAILSKYNLTEK